MTQPAAHDDAPAPVRCLIIRNPAARRQLKPAQLEAAAGIARRAGWDVTIAVTEAPGHATELAREAAKQGVEVIVVNGGDGTINEAVNGMAGTEAALGVLAGGTANVWAKESRAGRDPRKAMRAIVSGERRRVDVGRAGDRYFLLMAGVGFDAAIIPAVGPRLKRRLGAAAYVLAGIKTVFRYRGRRVALRIDDEAQEREVYWLLAGNTRSYGGIVDITHRAVMTDGLLDVGIMARGGIWRLGIDFVRLLLRRHDRSPNITFVRTRAVDIETPGIPVQVDGEPLCETPLRIEAVPAALTVMVPRGARLPLFGDR